MLCVVNDLTPFTPEHCPPDGILVYWSSTVIIINIPRWRLLNQLLCRERRKVERFHFVDTKQLWYNVSRKKHLKTKVGLAVSDERTAQSSQWMLLKFPAFQNKQLQTRYINYTKDKKLRNCFCQNLRDPFFSGANKPLTRGTREVGETLTRSPDLRSNYNRRDGSKIEQFRKL